MPAPYEEEMLQRGRVLAKTRGIVGTYGVAFHLFNDSFFCVAVRVDNDDVMISINLPNASWGYVYYNGASSCYEPEAYQGVVEHMREVMLLDDLAEI